MACATSAERMPKNGNAPAGRHGAFAKLRERHEVGVHHPPASAARVACGGDLRVVEQVMHRPVSGQTPQRKFRSSGYPTLRLRKRLGNP